MKSRKRTTEEISLQTTSEYSQRRCGRDMMWKTVPSTSCGDWKRPIADGRQACALDNQWRKRGGPYRRLIWSWRSVARWSSSTRYDGVVSCIQLHAHENSQLEINPFWRSQPVQLLQKGCNVSEPRRGKHKPRSSLTEAVEVSTSRCRLRLRCP